jgi:hypothetical protein
VIYIKDKATDILSFSAGMITKIAILFGPK